MPGSARTLVVNDEARIAEIVPGYLEAPGRTRAATGEEALAAGFVRKVYRRRYAVAEDQR